MRAGGGEQPPLLPQAVRLQRQQLPVLEAPAFSPLRREAAKMGADVRSLKFGSDKDLDQNIKQIFFFFLGKFLGGSELYRERGLPGFLKIKHSHSVFSSPTV